MTKFTRVYEDEDTIETWKFDLDKFKRACTKKIKELCSLTTQFF